MFRSGGGRPQPIKFGTKSHFSIPRNSDDFVVNDEFESKRLRPDTVVSASLPIRTPPPPSLPTTTSIPPIPSPPLPQQQVLLQGLKAQVAKLQQENESLQTELECTRSELRHQQSQLESQKSIIEEQVSSPAVHALRGGEGANAIGALCLEQEVSEEILALLLADKAFHALYSHVLTGAKPSALLLPKLTEYLQEPPLQLPSVRVLHTMLWRLPHELSSNAILLDTILTRLIDLLDHDFDEHVELDLGILHCLSLFASNSEEGKKNATPDIDLLLRQVLTDHLPPRLRAKDARVRRAAGDLFQVLPLPENFPNEEATWEFVPSPFGEGMDAVKRCNMLLARFGQSIVPFFVYRDVFPALAKELFACACVRKSISDCELTLHLLLRVGQGGLNPKLHHQLLAALLWIQDQPFHPKLAERANRMLLEL